MTTTIRHTIRAILITLLSVGALFAGDSKNIALIKKLDATWNNRNVDAAMEFYADDAVEITPDGNTLKGKAAIKEWGASIISGFHVASTHFREEGNKVMWDFTVHSDAFNAMGVNPVTGTCTAEIRDGKIVLFQPVFDQETLGKLTVHRFFQMYDSGADLNEIGNLFGDGFMAHYPGQPVMDSEGYKQLGAMFRAAFSEMKHSVKRQIASGEWVATQGVTHAVHTGDFQGIPASRKPVQMSFSVFDRVVNGKLTERHVDFDLMGLMQQIGAIPAPEQAQR